MTEQSFIDEVMVFDPSNLSAFQEPEKKVYDANIYKTNPVSTKVVSEDGHYRSTVKVLYNPYNIKKSIINQCRYVLQDEQGYLFVNSSLSEGDKNCPIFKGWKKLWFSGDDEKKQYARDMFERTESQWVLVQIMEDNNQPDLVGRLMAMKLPKVIFEKMTAKMNPSPESKKTPVQLMDFLIGPVLEMDVTPGPNDPTNPSRRQREISYNLCDFASDPTPITKVDGTPLFSESDLELIDTYSTARVNYEKAKTQAKKDQYAKEISELKEQIKSLYGQAIEYLKENAIDIEKECGYQPWSDEVTARVNKWIDNVVNMRNPGTVPVLEQATEEAPSIGLEVAAADDTDDFMDMPF